MITLKKSDLNSLIATYLQTSGYDHSYFTFNAEVKIETTQIITLEQLVQMGLQYYYVETHIRNGEFHPCNTKISLSEEHVCEVLDNKLKSETKDKKEEKEGENSESITVDENINKHVADDHMNKHKQSRSVVSKTETVEKEINTKDVINPSKRIKPSLSYQALPGNFPEAYICSWNDNYLAYGNDNVTIFSDNKEIGNYEVNSEVTSMAWSNNDTLSIGTYNGLVYLIDLETNTVKNIFDAHRGPVLSIKCRNNKVLTSGFDGQACVINNDEKNNLTRYSPHNNLCIDCEWITDEKFVTCSSDFNIAVVSPDMTEYLKGHVNTVNTVTYRENIIASSSDDSTVILWNIESKKNITLNGHNKPVHTHKWGIQHLYSGSSDGDLFLWDINKGLKYTNINVGKKLNVIETINDICIVGTDKSIIFYDKNGSEIRKINTGGVWDVKAHNEKVAVCVDDGASMVIDIRYV